MVASLSTAMPLPSDVAGAEALDLPGVACGPLPSGKGWKRRHQLLCETCPKADEIHRSWAEHGPQIVDQDILTEAADDDAVMVGGTLADINYGSPLTLQTCGNASVQEERKKSWLSFDISLLPDGVTIVGARLTFRAVTTEAAKITLSGLQDAEDNEWPHWVVPITWNNAPGNDADSATGLDGTKVFTIGGQDYAGGDVGDAIEFNSVEYPELVQFLRTDTDGLVTFILTATEAGITVAQLAANGYIPSGGSAGDWAPQLVIDYQTGDTTGLRAVDAHAAARRNRQLEFLSLVQYYNQLLNRIKWGIYYNQHASFETRRQFHFGFVSASGNVLTARRRVGDPDPGALEWSRLDYNSATNTNEIVDETGMMPACGVVGVQGSILRHSEWIVRRVPVAGSVAQNGTFEIHVEGDLGTVATPEPAGTELTVILTVHLDEPALEGWIRPRRAFPLYTERRVWTVLAASFPETEIFRLQTPGGIDVRIKSPSSHVWFNVLATMTTGATEDITDAAALRVMISNDDVSLLNMDGLLTDVAALAITYHYESAGASARWSGQDRCRWALEDFTASNGEADGSLSGRENGEGSTFYCGLAGASGRADFVARCYQVGVCDGWEEGIPTGPYNSDVWRQILVGDEGGPWQEWSTPGNPEPYVYRAGPPCLSSNAGLDMVVPDGYHAAIGWPANGGWEEWAANAAGTLTKLPGFWWRSRKVDSEPDMGDDATWPAAGPAGANWATRRLEIGDGDCDALTDVTGNRRAMLTGGGMAIQAYAGAPRNGLGYLTRCGSRLYTWVLQRLNSTAAVGAITAAEATQSRTDGTFLRAYFDANFNLQTGLNVGGESRYCARFTLAGGARLNRAQQAAVSGTVRTATVHKAYMAAGELVVELVNGEEWGGSLVTAGQAYETSWAQGGTNVDPPDFLKNCNYLTTFRLGHDELKVKEGMVAALPAAAFGLFGPTAAARYVPRTFAVTAAAAFSGEAQSWTGGSLSASVRRRRNLPGAWFMAYNNQDGSETIFQSDGASTQIVVQRNGGADTLALIRTRAPRPYIVGGLALDQYFVQEGYNELTSEYGVWFWFSQKNAAAASALHALWIMVQTYHATTGAELVDYGLQYHDVHPLDTDWSVSGTQAVTSIDAVKVRTRARDAEGEPITITLAAMSSLPATGADWPGTDYYYMTPGATIGDYVFHTHSLYALDEGVIEYTPDETFAGEAAYYDERVGIHGERPNGSLPVGHEAEACKGDLVRLADENGVLAAIIADDTTAFDGLAVTFSHSLIAHPVDDAHEPVVTRAAFGDAADADDVALTRETDYDWFGAAGMGFLRITDEGTVPSDGCLTIVAHGADRTAHARMPEHAALRRTVERLLEQGLSCAWESIVDASYPSGDLYNTSGAWVRANVGYDGESFGDDIPVLVGDPGTGASIGAGVVANAEYELGGTLPYFEMSAWVQMISGLLRIPELDRCPWPSSEVAEAEGVISGSFGVETVTLTYYWAATNETGNGIYHSGREQYLCSTVGDPVITTTMDGSIVLAKIYDDGDECRPIPILTNGVSFSMDGSDQAITITTLVKAYLDQKNNGALGFQFYPIFGAGGVLEPGEIASQSSLRKIRDACITWGMTYENDPVYVDSLGVTINDWGTGTVVFKKVTFAIGMTPIVVRFLGGHTLHANARVGYGVAPSG